MGFNIAWCEDALAAMRKMDYQEFDLALVDAPYGRKEHGGRDRRKLVKQRNGNKLYVSTGYYPKKEWDNAPCGKEYFDEIFRVSKHQIIFGINYFPICCGPGRIVWDKCNDGSAQSDCEIAYNSMTERVDMFRFMWRGMMQGKSIEDGTVQQGNKALNEKRIHPCQKPVALYTWILRTWAHEGWTVLDPFLGSGSSRIAAWDLGLDFLGIEIDLDYFDAQEKRFSEHTAQVSLWEDGNGAADQV